MSEHFKLPDDINMPNRFKKSTTGQRWFIAGVYDAIEGFSMTDPLDISQRQGATASEAYQLGYEAGQQRKRQ